MLDIIIQGGEVVTPQGVIQCDVAIAGETIAAIAAPGAPSLNNLARLLKDQGDLWRRGRSTGARWRRRAA
jgi:dihydroorotase-like cyclic amidohydrolase